MPADPAAVSCRLACAGIRLRDAASLGMPGWFRLAAPASDAVAEALVDALAGPGPRPPASTLMAAR